jgi:hypothetical protein
VLRGAQRTLREASPVVFVAFHSDEQRGSCKALLGQAGYSLYRLDGAPLDDDRPTDEIYALPAGTEAAGP